jgi:hypothetical protein
MNEGRKMPTVETSEPQNGRRYPTKVAVMTTGSRLIANGDSDQELALIKPSVLAH